MDFSWTDEQQMLLESTRRFVADHYDWARRRQIIASAEGRSAPVWQQFAELGLLGLNVPEAEGGLDGGPIGTMLVSQALGAALVVEPYLSSAVLATRAIAKLASQQQRSAWLPRLASGELVAIVAHDEPGTRHNYSAIDTRATLSGDSWTLSGQKAVVYHAPLADLLLVSARVGDGREWGLFAVPRDSPGIRLQSFTTVDAQRAADIELDNVSLPAGARVGGDVAADLPAVLDYGLTALCAEALGALDTLLAMTIEYARTRVQFGVPIGRFQALQHRMADMLTQVEQARSMAYLAASRCESPSEAERSAALSGAKVVIGRAARFVGQQAVQLHGGMGVTDELAVSHYFKRLLAFELRFGSTEAHLERYGAYL
ncbi:MAG TPA: acyl-CoA dehydrogenase family protein [Steroidobacteraceae bacterium]|nr:acyl-CoA dehydrogenase family protein [Steroidobacteraceae bacterium]